MELTVHLRAGWLRATLKGCVMNPSNISIRNPNKFVIVSSSDSINWIE
jgi:hypothetical protein